jgi:hypothetical protein
VSGTGTYQIVVVSPGGTDFSSNTIIISQGTEHLKGIDFTLYAAGDVLASLKAPGSV